MVESRFPSEAEPMLRDVERQSNPWGKPQAERAAWSDGLGVRVLQPGDPARRMGNEYVFQSFAEQNVATLNESGVTKIVASCPHCFNTLANEYPDFGGTYEVVHHTELLASLVREGRLSPTASVSAPVSAASRARSSLISPARSSIHM